jgi:hypothetical protein
LANPEHTHKWTVFLRGAHNQDLTYAISRVIFVLHGSYPDHRRGVLMKAVPNWPRSPPPPPPPPPSMPPCYSRGQEDQT